MSSNLNKEQVQVNYFIHDARCDTRSLCKYTPNYKRHSGIINSQRSGVVPFRKTGCGVRVGQEIRTRCVVNDLRRDERDRHG